VRRRGLGRRVLGDRGVALAEFSKPAFILNGHSVHVKEAQAHIARIAGEFGVEAQVVVSRRGDDISALAARALGEKREPVVAGGGDGTVNAVASRLAGADVALGVLPMGTLNHFARDAGVPRSLEAAVRNLFTGQTRKVDVGEVNGRVFVNNSGLGFYPHFVRQREELERRGRPKRVAFALALQAVVRRYLRLRIEAHMDRAEALERVTPFLFVGNNRYQTSGLEIGRRARLDSGRLWICTAPRAGRLDPLRAALRTLVSREPDPDLDVFETEEILVDPNTPRMNVSTDGEVSIMDAPLRFRARPLALKVVLPARGAAGRALSE
jgi:diacylglycerol kinase family enzyme